MFIVSCPIVSTVDCRPKQIKEIHLKRYHTGASHSQTADQVVALCLKQQWTPVTSPVQLQLLWLPHHFREALLWDCRLDVFFRSYVTFSSCRFFFFFAEIRVSVLPLRPQYSPPLIPPRGEVNAADAFDIGSFDEEDTKGIKVKPALTHPNTFITHCLTPQMLSASVMCLEIKQLAVKLLFRGGGAATSCSNANTVMNRERPKPSAGSPEDLIPPGTSALKKGTFEI